MHFGVPAVRPFGTFLRNIPRSSPATQHGPGAPRFFARFRRIVFRGIGVDSALPGPVQIALPLLVVQSGSVALAVALWEVCMGRTISIGNQSFVDMREHGDFIVDKTGFIREWWLARDQVTLITRPRRFGKTLNLSMLEAFFSTKFAGRADLFEGLDVWRDEEMRALQGTMPVIFLSFADIKEGGFSSARAKTCRILVDAFKAHADELGMQAHDWDRTEPPYGIAPTMDDATAASSIKLLCSLLERKTGKKPIVLLDEYDTPMQEAWTGGYGTRPSASCARCSSPRSRRTPPWSAASLPA